MEGGDSKMDETTDSKVVETALTIRSVLPSASPMQAWKTPWFQDGGCQTDDQRETKTSDICMQDAQSSVHGKRDYSRGHWHLKRQQQHRQATLELLGTSFRACACDILRRSSVGLVAGTLFQITSSIHVVYIYICIHTSIHGNHSSWYPSGMPRPGKENARGILKGKREITYSKPPGA